MISRDKHNWVHAVRYLLILPLLCILFLAFGQTAHSVPSIFPIKQGYFQHIISPFVAASSHLASKPMKEHLGIDISAKSGTPVRATAAGKIVMAERSGDWGNLVIIQHANGYQSRYAHLQDIVVKKDQIVNSKETIGHVGTTGMSKKPHLHYEVLKDKQRQNPGNYFKL